MSSSLEGKVSEVTRLEVKDQGPRFNALVDELIATDAMGQESITVQLQLILRRVLSEEVHPQVTKNVLVYLAKAARRLEEEIYFEFACYMLTYLKQQHQSSSSQYDDADFELRDGLFDYYINCGEYSDAAKILSGTNLDSPSRTFTAKEKVDIYIKCAEAVLEADEAIDAEVYVNKASPLINLVDDWLLQLRYRLTYARVLDANRKFIDAAIRYYELSMSTTTTHSNVSQDDVLELLAKAVTCAILGKASNQRSRVLGNLAQDSRISTLDQSSKYASHSSILFKMHEKQIIRKSDGLAGFEASLMPHQKATTSDGCSILEKAVIEHNMTATARIYDNICFTELAAILSMDARRAEKTAATMITEGRLAGYIDQREHSLVFASTDSALRGWDRGIAGICEEVSKFVDDAEKYSSSTMMHVS